MRQIILVVVMLFISSVAKSQYNNDIIIEPLLKTDTTSLGQRFVFPDMQNFEAAILKITIPPGKSTGWHKHSFPVFGYWLKGNLTAETENGKTFIYKENSSVSEMINTYHNATNNGDEDVILVVFYLGEKGKPLSVKKEIEAK
jgi:quercetin dioxygenase-like cupin family protein